MKSETEIMNKVNECGNDLQAQKLKAEESGSISDSIRLIRMKEDFQLIQHLMNWVVS